MVAVRDSKGRFIKGHIVDEHTRKAVGESNKIKPRFLGKHHSKETIEVLRQETLSRNWVGKANPFHGKTHSNETKKIISDKKIGQISPRLGVTLSDSTKKQISDTLKSKWQNEDFAKEMLCKLYVKPNKSELRLEELLNQIFPNEYKYVGNGQVFIAGFNPDYINFKKNKIIELYGDYWHKDSQVRDEQRLKVISSYDYDVLVVWDSEFKNLESLIKKLEGFNGRN